MTFLSTIKERFPALFFLSQHFLLLMTFTFALLYLKGMHIAPDALCQWDCEWYEEIKENGFVYSPDGQNGTGFFPLFPYIWKMTTLEVGGVALMNIAAFGLGFFFLIREYKPEETGIRLFLSIPVFFFFMVPYPEAFFFLFSSLLFVGIRKRDRNLAALSLFLAVFTRPVGIILTPAFLLMIIFLADSRNYFPVIREFLLYAVIAFGTSILMFYIHYLQTDVWFAYFKTHLHWGHYFRIPELPLRSKGDSIIAVFDGLALLTGIGSVLYLPYLLIQKWRGKLEIINRSLLLALMCSAGITLFILLFQGGDLHSLNRFIFCSAFYFILIQQAETKLLPFIPITLLILLSIPFWLLFLVGSSEWYSPTLIGAFIYTALYALATFCQFSWRKIFVRIFYVLSVGLQSFLFVEFLLGKWIG